MSTIDMKTHRGFGAVLVEVGDAHPAAGCNARTGIKIKLQDGAATQLQDRISH
jgi:hypothetical protein